MSDALERASELPRSEQELIKSRREVSELKDRIKEFEDKEKDKVRIQGTDRLVDKQTEQELRDVYQQLSQAHFENELFRKALLEIELEKQTIAYNQLGSALKIKILLQDPMKVAAEAPV